MNTALDKDQELLFTWLTTIGMLTMYWTPVERFIDQCVHLLYENIQKSGGRKKPGSLGRKLEYITAHLSENIVPKDDLINIVSLTKSTVKIRDVFVHGVLESYDENEIVIGKIEGKKEEHHIEMFTVDLNRLNRSAQNLNNLVEIWRDISHALLKSARNG